LASLDTVAAFELAIPEAATPQDVRVWVEAIRSDSELPLLVKLPLLDPLPLAEVALSRGADALVLGMPPIGAAYSQDKRLITGDYFGMGVVAQRLPVIAQCKQEFPDAPLIASGGVHTAADVKAYLAAGAQAVQLDVIIFIDPQRAQKILEKTATDGVG
jgi:dihydroorotate dehydrogenase